MAANISWRIRSTDDNEDESLYATPLYTAEDVICEGSDTEASPREIMEKHQRYEYFAKRTLQGHLPVLESARIKGPLNKGTKSEWVNPWRHPEPAWWRPGSTDMLFTRNNVMQRARQHGRRDLSPKEALAWCKRDARRQAIEMGMDDYSDTEGDATFNRSSEGDIEDQSMFGSSTAKIEETRLEIDLLSDAAPIPEAPESTLPTHINTKDAKQLDPWTGIKRPVDVAWLKGSHVSKRARWEEPAVSSPSPIPIASDLKGVDHNIKGVQHPKTPKIHSRLGLSLETPYQQPTLHKNHISPRHAYSGHDVEPAASNVIEQKRRRFSDLEFQRQPSNSFEYSFESNLTHPLQSSDQGDSVAQPSAIKSCGTPGFPVHPRLQAVGGGRVLQTPGNVSFVTDVAPSSGNLEQFQFRKKRRRKTDPPGTVSHPFATIEEGSQMPLSEGSKPQPSDGQMAFSQSSFVQQPVDKEDPLESPVQKRISALPNHTPFGISHADESWLTTQEDIEDTPSLVNTTSRIPPKGTLSPEWDDGDASWITTQNDSNQAGASSVVAVSKRFIRVSDSTNSTHKTISEDIDATMSRSPSQDRISTSLYSSPPPSHSSHIHSKSTPRLPKIYTEANSLVVPEPPDYLDGSSTQSYVTTPISSSKDKPQSSAAHVSSQNSLGSQRFPPRYPNILNPSSPASSQEDKIESGKLLGPQKLDHNSESDRKYSSEETATDDNEDMGEVAVLQAEINLHANAEAQEPSIMMSQSMILSSPVKTKPIVLGISAITSSQRSSGVRENSKAATPKVLENSKSDVPNVSSLPNDGGNHGDLIVNPLEVEEEAFSVARRESQVEVERYKSPYQERDDRKRLSPQSPWATTEAMPAIVPVVIATTEIEESPSPTSSQNSGWQKEEEPIPVESDVIRPFRDLMTPTPPPEQHASPDTQKRPSNTQLLVDAAMKNPWTSYSSRKSSTKKRVSFNLLEDSHTPNSPSSLQRRQASPPPPMGNLSLREEDKFDDEVTNVDRFKKHFSNVSKYKPTLSGLGGLLASSPAVDAMAEAFIAADRNSSREIDHNLKFYENESPSRSRKSKMKAYATFEDKDEDGDGDGDVNPPPFSNISALNETSSNATSKVGEHGQGDFLDEMGDFLGDWSIEGELKKATDLELKKTPMKMGSSAHGRGSIFEFENVWS